MRKIYFKGTVKELRDWLAYLIDTHGADHSVSEMDEYKSIGDVQ